MATFEDAVAELKSRIAVQEAELLDSRRALEVLEKLRPTGPAQAVSHAKEDEVIDISSLEPPQAVTLKENTFTGKVRSALLRLGEQEFHIGHVEALLGRMTIDIPGKHPRSRLASILGRLTDDGFLVRTFEGSGNVPHRFRIRRDDEPKTVRAPKEGKNEGGDADGNIVHLAA